MTLSDFTNARLVVPHLRATDAPGVIQELGQALQRENRVPDFLPFYHAALNREFLMGSNWEAGMAFPHARSPGLKAVAFALGRADVPIAWGASAGSAVRLVFLIAVPATDSTQYLPLISGLARLAKRTRLVEMLYAAADAAQIIEVMKQVALRTQFPPKPIRSGR